MKFKPVTLILVAIAAVLGGIVYLAERRSASQVEAESAQQDLFDFEEAEVQALTIRTAEQSLAFKKQGDRWQLISPEAAPANQAAVAYLLNLMATGSSERLLNVDAKERSQFGLDLPLASINVQLKNRQTYTLILGDYDFNRSFLYAQTNPAITDSGTLDVMLVAVEFENAVERSLDEWTADGDADTVTP